MIIVSYNKKVLIVAINGKKSEYQKTARIKCMAVVNKSCAPIKYLISLILSYLILSYKALIFIPTIFPQYRFLGNIVIFDFVHD